jgi:hypothetical protein
MSALFLNPDNAHVVAELGLVPRNDGRAILSDDPQVAGAILDLGRYLVGLQLLALAASVSRWADALATVRRRYALDTSDGLVVARPGQHEALVKNGFGAAVAHLLLNFVGHVKRSLPDLNLREVSLKAGLGVSLTDFAARLTQNRPCAKTRTTIIIDTFNVRPCNSHEL